MNPKYNSYLFSELVYLYKKEKDNEIKHELYDRMNFCGFDKTMIDCFIQLENTIIDYRNINYDTRLYEKYYWIKEKKCMYNNDYKNIFMSNSDKITKKTLTFSDCVCLLDEATYVLLLKNNISNDIINELKIFSELNNNSFIRKEIAYRFMLCYDKIQDKDNDMPDEYFKMIDKFVNNELRIINLCKWVYPNDKQNGTKIQWKPYTNEYYKYYS